MSAILVASAPVDQIGAISVVEDGLLRPLVTCEDPWWLAAHPTQPVVYAACLAATGPELVAWRATWSPELTLTALARFPLPAFACHLSVAPAGDAAYLSFYDANGVGRVALDEQGLPAGDPALVTFTGCGAEANRQEASHPHHTFIDHLGRLVVTDLGDDSLRILDATTLASLTIVELPAGSGPRHTAAVSPGTWVVSGELDEHVMLVVEEQFRDRVKATSGQAADRNYPSDIIAIGDGRAVVANRGVHSLTTVEVRGAELCVVNEWPAGGDWPMTVVLDDHLLLVTARDSGQLVAFQRNDVGEVAWSIELTRPTAMLRFEPTPARGGTASREVGTNDGSARRSR